MTTSALWTHRQQETDAAAGRILELAFAAGLGFLLFGDYLALSVSRLLTGQSAGWTTGAAVVQIGVLVLALVLGRLRGLLRIPELLWFVGLSAVFVAHVVLAEVFGRGLNDYGIDKVVAWFCMHGPALLCGIAAGRSTL